VNQVLATCSRVQVPLISLCEFHVGVNVVLLVLVVLWVFNSAAVSTFSHQDAVKIVVVDSC